MPHYHLLLQASLRKSNVLISIRQNFELNKYERETFRYHSKTDPVLYRKLTLDLNGLYHWTIKSDYNHWTGHHASSTSEGLRRSDWILQNVTLHPYTLKRPKEKGKVLL